MVYGQLFNGGQFSLVNTFNILGPNSKDVDLLMWCSENRYLGAIKALDVIRKDSCWLTLKS